LDFENSNKKATKAETKCDPKALNTGVPFHQQRMVKQGQLHVIAFDMEVEKWWI
jgi:hypothetical protein